MKKEKIVYLADDDVDDRTFPGLYIFGLATKSPFFSITESL